VGRQHLHIFKPGAGNELQSEAALCRNLLQRRRDTRLQRIINGAQVLFNYDIFAEAGKNKGTIKEFTVPVNGSGQIVIQYANIPGKDNAKSSGMEILSASNAPPTAPTGLAAAAVSPHGDCLEVDRVRNGRELQRKARRQCRRTLH